MKVGKQTFVDEEGKTYVAKKKKPFYKKVWFWILVVLVVGIAAGAGGGGADTDNASEVSTTQEEVAVDDATTEEATLAKIGEELKVGDVVFKASKTSTATNVGGEYGENAQGTYLIVDLEVRNEGNEAITMDSSFFKLLCDGKEFDSDSSAGIYANDQADFFLTDVNPDMTLKGKVVFDVSDAVLKSDDQVLQVQTGAWGTETGKISLK